MGRKPTKAADNIFCKARIQASTYNEKLCSKDGASELLGISVSSLSDYELGLTKVVPPDMVVKMADLYNDPTLKNYYCREMCPIGCDFPELELEDLDRITIKAMSSLRKLSNTKEILLDITEDGKISKDERSDLAKVIEDLDEITAIAQSLKAWVEKNLEQGVD